MTKISPEERKKALEERTLANAKNRDSGGNWKKAVDFSKMKGEISFFKPKKGYNTIDILPYLITTKNHPQKMKEGYSDYLLDIWIHIKVGPAEGTFVCLKRTFNKPCPICEEMQMLKDEDEKKNEDEIKKRKPSRRAVYNVIDVDEESKGIQIWDVSHFLFEKELLEEAETAEESVITFADLENGRSIKFRATGDSIDGNSFFRYKAFSFLERQPFEEDALNDTFSLDAALIIPTYEEVRDAFNGVEEEEEIVEEKEHVKEAAPARRSRTTKPVEEPAPARKRPARGTSAATEKKEVEDTRCSFNHVFGSDCDEKDDCKECEDWEVCADEKDALNGKK